MIILFAISVLLTFLLYITLIRNNKVCDYRLDIIDKISKKGDEDIAKGREWKWRYDEFNRVDYDSMVYKFWIPLHKFYNIDHLLRDDK